LQQPALIPYHRARGEQQAEPRPLRV